MLTRRGFLRSTLLLPAARSLVDRTARGDRLVRVGTGWARNQINAVIFRREALATHGDTQYVSYYDETAHVVIARRRLVATDWELRRTSLTGNVRDAHNSISMAVDGRGYLHLAWDHHASALRYCRSVTPGSLDVGEAQALVGDRESQVTYPEFYALPDGDLLFLYRDGRSGDGTLVVNRFDARKQKWSRLHDTLISGEGRRNAYWQAAIDRLGAIHVSWVWRETPDVRTNHDIAYMVSRDAGKTWLKSSGEPYKLPITAASAEYAARIPEGSDLINQTSMCVDHQGRPIVATYWRPEGRTVPQFHVVFHDSTRWRTSQITRRRRAFSLGGGGTQRIPVSRPLLLSDSRNPAGLFVIFRDTERASRITLARCVDLAGAKWTFSDLTDFDVGSWEPCYDAALWRQAGRLHLFVQRVGQGAHESLDDLSPQAVHVLEVDLTDPPRAISVD